ncbi:hypothetical protein B0H63DRAFT_476299 [Podospora didyma]|uniref:Uncharacterized protein n=1 Tax=Podospora didyma TaxID=330526 RepID=A0AAE0TW33_9PEZI|nr:hypothetical protein B0H63DRAFT_476299 [Podospora didyma]
MSRVMPPPPPLLLTKRVTAFLRANLSANVRAAALTTPAGNLLAHASNLPASALRRQCAVAASLWALHAPTPPSSSSDSSSGSTFGDAVDGAAFAPSQRTASNSSINSRRPTSANGSSAPAVTVQLDSGAVFVIRQLRCGMLFICMGGKIHEQQPTNAPSSSKKSKPIDGQATPQGSSGATPGTQSTPTTTTQEENGGDGEGGETPDDAGSSTDHTPNFAEVAAAAAAAASGGRGGMGGGSLPIDPRSEAIDTAGSAPSSTNSSQNTTTTATNVATSHGGADTTIVAGGGGGSSINSTNSSAGTTPLSTASVQVMRRQVEELARWLDARLGALCVPEEGIGITPTWGSGAALEMR